jgi:demethylmenaquinone methyltransferase/2-methoxy-6-polyprenyl-1,4-benzoquinol methylase
VPQSESTGQQAAVRELFKRIAARYDFLNRVMSLGRDRAWRREVIRRVQLPAAGRLFDLGAGTGDLAREALRRERSARVFAADLTIEMIRLGRRRSRRLPITWICADALHLPFAGQSFDGVVSGFLIRNVGDTGAALAEQRRVLRPGGRLVCLDTTPPAPGCPGWVPRMYLARIVPGLGRWLAGDRAAYQYLASTTAAFVTAEALAERIQAAGYHQVGFRRRMLGAVAIHFGRRPPTGGESPSRIGS